MLTICHNCTKPDMIHSDHSNPHQKVLDTAYQVGNAVRDFLHSMSLDRTGTLFLDFQNSCHIKIKVDPSTKISAHRALKVTPSLSEGASVQHEPITSEYSKEEFTVFIEKNYTPDTSIDFEIKEIVRFWDPSQSLFACCVLL